MTCFQKEKIELEKEMRQKKLKKGLMSRVAQIQIRLKREMTRGLAISGEKFELVVSYRITEDSDPNQQENYTSAAEEAKAPSQVVVIDSTVTYSQYSRSSHRM